MRLLLAALALSLGLCGCTATKNVLLSHAITFEYTLAPQKQTPETLANLRAAVEHFARGHGLEEATEYRKYFSNSDLMPFRTADRSSTTVWLNYSKQSGQLKIGQGEWASESTDMHQFRVDFEAMLTSVVGADGFTMKQHTNYWVDAA